MEIQGTDSQNSSRHNDGKWKKGVSGNAGRTFQTFKERLAYWLETKTITEIEKLVLSKREWGKLVAIDGLVVRRIHAAFQADNSGGDFALVLDRLLGKAPQAITGEDGKPLLAAIDVNELARRTAFLLSLPQAAAPVTIEQQSTKIEK